MNFPYQVGKYPADQARIAATRIIDKTIFPAISSLVMKAIDSTIKIIIKMSDKNNALLPESPSRNF